MKFLDLLFASRPLLHLPIWSVYLVSIKSIDANASVGWDDLAMMICLNLLAGGAYYLNQVYDYESDRFNRKLGFLQRGALSMNDMWLAYMITSLAALGIGLLISKYTIVLLAQFLILGALYSLPPARLKDRPLAGMIVNAWSFGWLVSFAAMPERIFYNFGSQNWLLPFYFFLAVGATHILTTLPDRSGDQATGKVTIAVILSNSSAKLFALVLLAGSYGIAHYALQLPLAALSLLSVLVLIVSIFLKSRRMELLATKLPILLLTLLAGYYYPFYLIFVVVLILLTRVYYRRRFDRAYPELA